jgi:flagellin-like hook-associated protein FlgL
MKRSFAQWLQKGAVMTSVSAYAAPLSAVSSAQASQSSAVASATSYGQRPAMSMDAVSAIQVTNALSQRVNHLNQIRALERADGLVNVTLAAVEAIEDTLMEMRALSASLQDASLSEDHRAKLSQEYGALVPRIRQITEMATFGSRNLVNPQAASQSGDVALPGGMSINAVDLRPGITGAISDIDILVAPALENLRAAFDFEGSLNPVAWTNGFGATQFNAANVSGDLYASDGPNADQSVNTQGPTFLFALSPPISFFQERTFSLNVMLDETDINGGIGFIYLLRYTNSDENFLEQNQLSINVNRMDGHIRFRYGDQPQEVIVTQARLKPGDWANITITQSSNPDNNFGDTKILLNGRVIGSVFDSNPLLNTGRIRLNEGRYSDLALWDRVLDGRELAQATSAMKRGVHNWRPEITTADWATKMSALDQSLGNVRQVAQQYGGASRSITARLGMQQRMTDIIDAGVARLVNRDIERVGALQVASQVRTQLAQAMMQTQTGIMNAQVGLLSNSLALFDSINIGGFAPGRLRPLSPPSLSANTKLTLSSTIGSAIPSSTPMRRIERI